MRITRQQADANKARVVETAASLFREKGFDRVSVADLMTPGSIISNGLFKPFLALIPIVLFCLWQGLSRPFSMSLCYLSFAATLLTLWATVAFQQGRSSTFLPR